MWPQLIKIVIFLVLAPLVITSCGKRTHFSSKNKSPQIIKKIWGDPIILKRHDQTCDSSSSVPRLDSRLIDNIFSNNSFKSTMYPFNNYSGKLVGKIVSYATTNYILENISENLYQILQPSKYLYICKKYFNYPEETLEDVALSTLYTIDQVYDAYMQTSMNSNKMNQILMELHPLVMKKVTSARTGEEGLYTLVDNASYDYLTSTIIIYPQSKTNKQNKTYLNGIPLWKIPFVIAHEFGHHVFHTHFQKSNIPLNINLNLLQSHLIDTPYFVTSKVISYSTLALHEMFADLFATYSLSDDIGSIKKLSCFSYRDVRSKFFGNLIDKKILTDNVIEIYSDDTENIKNNEYDCETPNFKDIHHVGSILAFGLNKLFDDSSIIYSKNERLKTLLLWADTLDKNYHDIPKINIKAFLIDTISRFIKILNNQKAINFSQCQTIGSVFPALFETFFQDKCQILPKNYYLSDRISYNFPAN